MNVMNTIRKLHKWLGLLIGVQLVLWAISGLVFAWLDHHEVQAEHSAHPPAPASLAAVPALIEPAAWLHEYAGRTIREIRLTSVLDRPVWRIEAADGVQLRDAVDGQPFTLDEPFVRRMASAFYKGDGQLAAVTHHATPTLETRKSGAVWRVDFNDAPQTALYFAADDGRLVAARNETWRLFDFFWMLHTMDYRGRDNFNHPVIIAFGTGALWLALSGVLLLLRSFRRRDFAFLGLK
jgi:uncharacterized iron-regulated membrane protein